MGKKEKKFLKIRLKQFIFLFVFLVLTIQLITSAELTPEQKEAERIRNNQIIDEEFNYTDFSLPGLPERNNESINRNVNNSDDYSAIYILMFAIFFTLIVVVIIVIKKSSGGGISKFRG